MSLGEIVKGTSGVVLAADNRLTVFSTEANLTVPLHFDNATKVLNFEEPHNFVGVVTYGSAVIDGQRTAHSYVPEIDFGTDRLPIDEYARRLQAFFQERWSGNNNQEPATFLMSGYSPERPYGDAFEFTVPGDTIKPLHPQQENGGEQFGMTWGGQGDILVKIIENLKVPLPTLPLQDCVDLAIFMIRTTITAQNLSSRMRGVGGAIDVATITRTGGFTWIQKQQMKGER